MKLLFERLTTSAEPFDLKQSVFDQIRRTVAGFTAAGNREDITIVSAGLPAVVDIEHDNTRQINAFADRMKALICHYEPRLQNTHVSLLPTNDPLTPYRLSVSGVLDDDESKEWVEFPIDIQAS